MNRLPLIALLLAAALVAAAYFFMQRDHRATRASAPPATLPLEGPLVRQTDNRDALLALPYTLFDQTKGSGWRPLYDELRQCRQAAALIEDYLPRHSELTPVQRATLHFHAAQMLASEGQIPEALAHLGQSHTPDLGPAWNTMVDATRAFLQHDRPALLAARAKLPTHGDEAEEVDTLIECFGDSYADMRWWAPLPATVACPHDLRATAERLATTLGLPLTETPTKPANCIWLELHPWDPSSGYPWDGYMILHFRGGTVITASNPHWLDAAITRFLESSRTRNGKREAPTGLMTSYRLAR